MSSEATEFKNEGNEYFKNKEFEKAIECYSRAIEICPDDYMFYSNRSAALASLGKYNESLEDAKTIVSLNPTWGKGYSRLGAALEYLGREGEAIEAYQTGLKHDPTNTQLNDAVEKLEGAKGSEPSSAAQYANMPGMSELFKNPHFMEKLARYKENPGEMFKDPELMKMFSKYMPNEKTSNGGGSQRAEGFEDKCNGGSCCDDKGPAHSFTGEKKAETHQAAAKEEKESDVEKEKGNACYKKREFEEAIAHYKRAKELDPNTIMYDLNISAVLYEQGKYEECIEMCLEIIERGREMNESYRSIAKAYTRIGSVYAKLEKYEDSMKYYNKSLAEFRDPEIVKKLKSIEKICAEEKQKQYVDPEIAENENQTANACFTKGQYPDAVKHYTEAIKRNPSNPKYYSNRAAAYTKLMEYHLCIQDCDKSIAFDNKFVKAYLRKANALVMLRDHVQAKNSYEKVLEIEKNNGEAYEGLSRCREALRQMKPEEAAQSAMRDPEIQQILADPSIRQALEAMQTNPQACQKYLSDPTFAHKIEKLISAGIVKVGNA